MELKKPKNNNYCANVVEIKNIIPLENCDNVVHTNIFGNMVVVDKNTKIGDVGLYFPSETQLSDEFISKNNLYRHSHKNKDNNKKGFFEDNRRVKTVKFRGNQSQGFFIPLSSIENIFNKSISLNIGDEFDELFNVEICRKYIVRTTNKSNSSNKKISKKILKSRIIDNQFKFHPDTAQLWKNIQNITPDDYIHISYKIHGTSSISSKILCKKKNPILKVMRLFGIPIIDYYYDNIYSSRKVIKNGYFFNNKNHYYKKDIWKSANEKLKDYLLDGMSIYYEIAGFVGNKYIQKDYDYGCKNNQFEIYIYRITFTNINGNVFEFSSRQVQDWCKSNNLNPVPEIYYGKTIDIDKNLKSDCYFHENLLKILNEKYTGGNCWICKNKVPAEGIVIRIDKPYFQAYKLKTFEFMQRETKELNKDIENIEDNQ